MYFHLCVQLHLRERDIASELNSQSKNTKEEAIDAEQRKREDVHGILQAAPTTKFTVVRFDPFNSSAYLIRFDT